MNEHKDEVTAFIGPEQAYCSAEAALASRMNKLMATYVSVLTICKTHNL